MIYRHSFFSLAPNGTNTTNFTLIDNYKILVEVFADNFGNVEFEILEDGSNRNLGRIKVSNNINNMSIYTFYEFLKSNSIIINVYNLNPTPINRYYLGLKFATIEEFNRLYRIKQ